MFDTNTLAPPSLFNLLAHDIRWQLVQMLRTGDMRVQELVAAAGRPQNLVSYHLRQLRAGGLVHEQRSSADGRDVYYTLDQAQLAALYAAAGAALFPTNTTPRPLRVLFLCTHNSARSQLAEGILRALGGDMIESASAGTQPTSVHPLAIEAAAALGLDLGRQHSKGLAAVADGRYDAVITVCDRARELCPLYPGNPRQIHWSIADPAAVSGTLAARQAAFQSAADMIVQRSKAWLRSEGITPRCLPIHHTTHVS